MNIVRALDGVSSFLLEPCREDRSPLGKGVACVTTLALGIISLGLAQGISLLWKILRRITVTPKQTKINSLFPNSKSKETKNPSPPTTSPLAVVPPSPSSLLSTSEIAKSVYDSRNQMWETAKVEVHQQGKDDDEEALMSCFIGKIRTEFKKNGSSLLKISEDPQARDLLFKSQRLRQAILSYATTNRFLPLIQQHLTYLTLMIYNARDTYTERAASIGGGDPLKQFVALTYIIKQILKTEQRSLAEIVRDPSLVDIFNQSVRLRVVLALYVKMTEKPSASKTVEEEEDDSTVQQRERAILLGQQHAAGKGLVTQFGLQDVAPADLRQAVIKIIFKNHPDKNPDADPELIRQATLLKELLDQGQFEKYREVIEKIRSGKH